MFSSAFLDNVNFTASDFSEIPIRNRIYITIDSSLNISINSHLVSLEEFPSSFEFVYTNPKNLPHLPETPANAIICYKMEFANRTDQQQPPYSTKNKKQFEIGQITLVILKTIQQLQENYALKHFKMDLQNLNPDQIHILEKQFPYHIAFSSKEDIQEEKGITVKLPKYNETININNKQERNIITVQVKSQNKLFLRGSLFPVEELKDTIKAFIINPYNNPSYPESPKRMLVSLRNTKDTNYKFYLQVYNNIKAAYDEVRETKSYEHYNKSFEHLNYNERKTIVTEVPMAISETE